MKNDPANLAEDLRDFIRSFSVDVQEILEAYDICAQIARLDKANLLNVFTYKPKFYLLLICLQLDGCWKNI